MTDANTVKARTDDRADLPRDDRLAQPHLHEATPGCGLTPRLPLRARRVVPRSKR